MLQQNEHQFINNDTDFNLSLSFTATYCYLDKQQGPCKQALNRLYYDPRANTCKEFIYGGCEGNDNNFNTFEECENACVRKTPGKDYHMSSTISTPLR